MLPPPTPVATRDGEVIDLHSLTGEQLRALAAVADEREARALSEDDEELRDSLWRTATLRMPHGDEQAEIVKALDSGVHPLIVAQEHMRSLLRARFGHNDWPTAGFYRAQAQLAVAA